MRLQSPTHPHHIMSSRRGRAIGHSRVIFEKIDPCDTDDVTLLGELVFAHKLQDSISMESK